MEQEELLIKIAGILEKLNIPYAVTGGIAVSVWGRARFTADIDIAVELFPEKLKDLASELLKIDKDVYVDELSMQRALEKKGEFNFIHPASGFLGFKRNFFRQERSGEKNIQRIFWYKRIIYFSGRSDIAKIIMVQNDRV